MKRNWAAALDKVMDENRCRACRSTLMLEAAHIIPRSRVAPGPGDNALNIVPLCRPCHARQHRHLLWLGPLLTTPERAYAEELVGEGEAARRLDPPDPVQ